MGTVQFECDYCGEVDEKRASKFERNEHNFCSRECFNDWQAAPEIECANCGVTFSRKPSQIERAAEPTCSVKCMGEVRRARVEVECAYCGKEIQRKESQIRGQGHYFCDHRCKGEWQSGENHWRYKHGEGETECDWCGETFRRSPSKNDLYESGRTFCKRGCFDSWAADAGIRAGENNGNWRGGYDPYYGPNWEEQRERALDRDGRTCQGCGDDDVDVLPHHIRPFREFDGDYEAANDLSNLVTLCWECHPRWEGIPVRPVVV